MALGPTTSTVRWAWSNSNNHVTPVAPMLTGGLQCHFFTSEISVSSKSVPNNVWKLIICCSLMNNHPDIRCRLIGERLGGRFIEHLFGSVALVQARKMIEELEVSILIHWSLYSGSPDFALSSKILIGWPSILVPGIPWLIKALFHYSKDYTACSAVKCKLLSSYSSSICLH